MSEVETGRLISFVIRSAAPFFMSLIGLIQWRWNHLAPKAACDKLPLSKLNGLRVIVTILLIIFSIAGIVISVLESPVYVLDCVQHGLELVAWSLVFYMQLQELRRFIVFRRVLQIFYVMEAGLLIEEVYTVVTAFVDGNGSQQNILAVVLLILQYPCNFIMAVTASRIVPRPRTSGLWWNAEEAYEMKQYPVTSFSPSTSGLHHKGRDAESSFSAIPPSKILLSDEAESSLSKPRKKKNELNKSLLSDTESGTSSDSIPMPSSAGPLSLFIQKWEVAGSEVDGWNMSDVWGRSYYIVFSVRVKWDKKMIWDVQRRYSDFKLLFYYLQRDGVTDKLNFTEPEFPRRSGLACLCQCCTDRQFEQQAVLRLIKGLNTLVQDMLLSPAGKSHPMFRAFCAQGRVLQSGERFNDALSIYDFELMNLIGKGSYGKVMQARKKDSGKIYAIKVLKKTDLKKASQIKHTKTERHILGNVVHPFICSLRYAFQDQSKLFMVLDFFNGGELFFHLNKGRFPEARTRYYIAEICLALEHLHSNNIVYRDLKPENVLLDSDGHIKLTDFGLSKKFKKGENEAKTFCGTPQYLAPEIILGKGYGYGVDWWAMGALTYELLTRTPPFQERDAKRLYNLILTAPVSYPTYLSVVAKSFCAALLEKNPLKRLGSCGAEEIKSHPFFEGIDWKLLREKKIDVPFKPDNSDLGLDNVWPEFKSEKVKDTPIDPPMLDSLDDERKFSQFSYAQPETYMTYVGSQHLGGDFPPASSLRNNTRPRGLLGSVHRLAGGKDKTDSEYGVELDESDTESDFPTRLLAPGT